MVCAGYEFGIDKARKVTLKQRDTYAPDKVYRWMAIPAIDKLGNIGLGYSFGGAPNFAGTAVRGTHSIGSPGTLGPKETILVEAEASQINTLRWEDHMTTAVDPLDDCTIWYVGDYLKKDAQNYSARIAIIGWTAAARRADGMPASTATKNDVAAATE